MTEKDEIYLESQPVFLMDRIHQLFLWTNFLTQEVEVVSTLQDQENF